MARFTRIGSQIRANRLILANRFRVPKPNPLFCESRFGGLKTANHRFEAIRANCSHIVKIGLFLRIDSRESPRFALRIAGPSKLLSPKKNCPDSSFFKEVRVFKVWLALICTSAPCSSWFLEGPFVGHQNQKCPQYCWESQNAAFKTL